MFVYLFVGWSRSMEEVQPSRGFGVFARPTRGLATIFVQSKCLYSFITNFVGPTGGGGGGRRVRGLEL